MRSLKRQTRSITNQEAKAQRAVQKVKEANHLNHYPLMKMIILKVKVNNQVIVSCKGL